MGEHNTTGGDKKNSLSPGKRVLLTLICASLATSLFTSMPREAHAEEATGTTTEETADMGGRELSESEAAVDNTSAVTENNSTNTNSTNTNSNTNTSTPPTTNENGESPLNNVHVGKDDVPKTPETPERPPVITEGNFGDMLRNAGIAITALVAAGIASAIALRERIKEQFFAKTAKRKSGER
jgi:hypothetical protein